MAVSEDKPKEDPKVETKKDGKKPEAEEPLSEEDQALQAQLDLLVERVCEDDVGLQKTSLDSMVSEIRTATASMTSVPKPLKFLNSHTDTLRERFEQLPEGENRKTLAEILAVLATTTIQKEGERAALKYCLAGSREDLQSWGHEFLRHLAGEIATEFEITSPSKLESKDRITSEASTDDLLGLVNQIVPFHMTHNAEPEAVDLLLEVDQLSLLPPLVDEKNYARTCLYLVSCCSYLPEPDDSVVLDIALKIYLQMGKYHDAMRVALRANKPDIVASTLAACTDPLEKKQLCYLLARQGVVLDLEEGPAAVEDEDLREALRVILSNSCLSGHYLALARDLDVMEPKQPEDVYKTHLIDGRTPTGAAVDSARQNLASTFVNAFLNAGFGTDKLVTPSEGEGSDSTSWIFKNKDHGKMSAVASVGMITLWDAEGGLPQIDKYLYSTDGYVVAGALLGIGVVNACVQNENDPAFALLSEYLEHSDVNIRTGAILGLGLAYAGSNRLDMQDMLIAIVTDSDVSMEICGFAALSLGLIFTSACHEEIVMAILQALMSRSEAELQSPFAKFLCLGLGLLFLGKQDIVEATMEVCKTLDEHISKFCQVTLMSLAYAGTGDVLKVQELLAMCGEHIETEDNTAWKAPAVLGIALIAMGEPLGSQMAQRSLEHLLQYGEAPVRRAVPLAVAALFISKPEMTPMDMLSRLSHDTDSETAQNAVVALGMVGAGTNNARLAGILRNLSSYYYKEPTMLYLVKVAQGLVHMGKGLMTIAPYHTEGQLLSGMALAGNLTVLFACMDMKATIAGKHHYLLFALATAMKPRMLMTLDEEGKLLPTSVRVGQAVDVVAQAGRPKTITGFQTHTTPVLMSVGERAELGSEKYIPLSPILEGQVILKANPEWVESTET
eukprot:gene9842-7728_t